MIDLGSRSNPNYFPQRPNYPDDFDKELNFNYISSDIQEKLKSHFRNNKISKEEQKNKFLNMKQETDFYKRLLPTKEQEKEKLLNEIGDIKSKSMYMP